MGILDDYLNASPAASPASPAGAAPAAPSIIDQFLMPEPAPLPNDRQRVYINTPKPPISDATKEQSDAINAGPSQAGGANPRDSATSEGIANYPAFVGNSLKTNFTGGLDEIGAGVANKSPKDIGLGLLRSLTAIPAAAHDAVAMPIAQITGNPDIGDRAGFIASSAVPVVPGLGLVSKLPSSVTGTASAVNAARPTVSALKTLVENIGPENLPSVVRKMKENPRLGPADLSPRVLQDTQHLFVNDGPQIDYLAKTSANRMATSKDTINNAFDSAMGPTVNAADKLQQLKEAARKVGKEQIEPVLAANPHTDVTDLVKHIDKEIGPHAMRAIKNGESPPIPLNDYQRELLSVRGKLRGEWPDKPQMLTYTDKLHAAQSELREKAQGLANSAVGSERNLSRELFSFREKMKDAVGPEYKKALEKYADEKQVDAAFHYGHDSTLKNGKALENDPSFFEKWVNDPKRKPAELEAAREGARRAVSAEIEGTRSAATNPASKGIAIGQVDFNRQRLTTLLGKEEADKLLTKLDDTRLEANTHNKIIEGSQTAMRSASKDQFSMPTKTDVMKAVPAVAASEAANFFMGGMPGIGTGIISAAKVGALAKDAISMKLAREHNLQYAKLALPTEGPSRNALIKSLEAAIPGPKRSLLTRGASTLSRLVAP